MRSNRSSAYPARRRSAYWERRESGFPPSPPFSAPPRERRRDRTGGLRRRGRPAGYALHPSLLYGRIGRTPVAGRVVVAEGMLSPGCFYYFEQRGAIAQVYVNKGNAHELTVSTIWARRRPRASRGCRRRPSSHSRASRAPASSSGSRREKR